MPVRFQMEMVSVPETSLVAISRLVLAVLLGAAVGVNRELRGKPAGLRTHALVALGAAMLTIIGLALTAPQDAERFGAASRVLQGLVAGIGFIGGGVILRREESNEVLGLSTAASIWIVAATGVGAGGGLWITSSATALLALAILALGDPLDRWLRARRNEAEDERR
jgi:putative Mg2+ transporter-C (MgtC) family protein